MTKLNYITCSKCGGAWANHNMEFNNGKCSECYTNQQEAKLWNEIISLVEYRHAETDELLGTFKNISLAQLAQAGYVELCAFDLYEMEEFIKDPIVWKTPTN